VPQAQQVAATADDRYRKVTLDEAASTFAFNEPSRAGVTLNRIDFIRHAYVTGQKQRGAIAKELTRITGQKVTYQIVFAATKGVPGGPPSQQGQPAPVPTAPSDGSAPAAA
jgi:hypothetical protein